MRTPISIDDKVDGSASSIRLFNRISYLENQSLFRLSIGDRPIKNAVYRPDGLALWPLARLPASYLT